MTLYATSVATKGNNSGSILITVGDALQAQQLQYDIDVVVAIMDSAYRFANSTHPPATTKTFGANTIRCRNLTFPSDQTRTITYNWTSGTYATDYVVVLSGKATIGQKSRDLFRVHWGSIPGSSVALAASPGLAGLSLGVAFERNWLVLDELKEELKKFKQPQPKPQPLPERGPSERGRPS